MEAQAHLKFPKSDKKWNVVEIVNNNTSEIP